MKLPRWICRDERERKLLEEWTIARLDEELLEAADPADFMPDDEASAVAIQKFFEQRRKRGRVLVAVKAKDWKTVARLALRREVG
jgi:hypothetical protein